MEALIAVVKFVFWMFMLIVGVLVGDKVSTRLVDWMFSPKAPRKRKPRVYEGEFVRVYPIRGLITRGDDL